MDKTPCKKSVTFGILGIIAGVGGVFLLKMPDIHPIINIAGIIMCAFYVIVGWGFAATDFSEAFKKFKQTKLEEDPPIDHTFLAPMRFAFAIAIWPIAILYDELGDK